VKFAQATVRSLKLHIDVYSQPTIQAQLSDVTGTIPHTNNGAEAYHSHLNAEYYVKHPDIIHFCRCTEEGSLIEQKRMLQ